MIKTKTKSKKLTTIIMIAGTFLIVSAIAFVMFSVIMENKNANRAKEITKELLEVMPDVSDSVFDDRINTRMSSLEIDGTDFIGILEVPLYSSKLPVCSKWSKWDVSKYPCRYMGSIYEEKLIIGGSDKKGQLSFMENITEGDSVFFTDVTGARYSYSVSKIKKTKNVSLESLSSFEADIVFFAKDSFGSEYTIVGCEAL